MRWEDTVAFAAYRGDLSEVRRLLQAGRSPDESTDDKTPLMQAVDEPGEAFGDTNHAIALALLDAGANVNARDERGWTALHFAVNADKRAAALLLAAGADPNAVANDGRTPLHQTAEQVAADVV